MFYREHILSPEFQNFWEVPLHDYRGDPKSENADFLALRDDVARNLRGPRRHEIRESELARFYDWGLKEADDNAPFEKQRNVLLTILYNDDHNRCDLAFPALFKIYFAANKKRKDHDAIFWLSLIKVFLGIRTSDIDTYMKSCAFLIKIMGKLDLTPSQSWSYRALCFFLSCGGQDIQWVGAAPMGHSQILRNFFVQTSNQINKEGRTFYNKYGPDLERFDVPPEVNSVLGRMLMKELTRYLEERCS